MWFERPITGTSLPDGHLCLTFDDGPADSSTLQIARYLSEQQIPAAFFIVGAAAAVGHGSILREIVSLGHTLGNHTRSHRRLTASTTSDALAIDEVLAVQQVVAATGAPTPAFFRPPFGAWNGRLAFVFNQDIRLRDSPVGPIGWDIDGEDYRYWRESRSPQDCADNYLAAVERRPQRSGIVLLHDATADAQPTPVNRTAEMIQLLIPQLRSRGYRFSELSIEAKSRI